MYSKDTIIPDFNVLFTGLAQKVGNKKSKVVKTMLSSMLTTFKMTKNVKLEASIVKVMTRCYN